MIRTARIRGGVVVVPFLVCLWLLGCGQSRAARANAAAAPASLTWSSFDHVAGVVDLSEPAAGGSIAVAAAGKLLLLRSDGRLQPYAPGYSAPAGLEPYIALSSGQSVGAAHCRFAADDLYALRLRGGNGVTVVDAQGGVRRFARLGASGLENGIAFDGTGRFGHRLLVTTGTAGRTTVSAIDCRGHVRVLTRNAPRVEGGIAVAPASFGRFGGDLIAPDERSGNIYAIGPDGRSHVLARSGLPHGPDIGVESEGFVPRAFTYALVADRRTPHNRHPGDNVILSLTRTELAKAGVRPGDLLVAAEGGATTIALTCGHSCRVRSIAVGPSVAHLEGHIVFAGAIGSGDPAGFVSGTCAPACVATPNYTSYHMTNVPWASTGVYAPAGASTAVAAMGTRQVAISRPANLVNDSLHPTPLVITTGHAAITNDPQWMAAAAQGGFMLAQITSTCPPPSGAGYCKPTTDRPGDLSTSRACGSNGAVCDDIPMVLAVLDALETCNGSSSSGTWLGTPPPCENINPNEVFIEGGSAGSTLAMDVACDTRTSSRFAGIQALSGSMFAATVNGTQKAPNCPALLGVGPHCIQDCVAAPINRKISLQWIWGTNDQTYNRPQDLNNPTSTFDWSGCPVSPGPTGNNANCLGTGIKYLGVGSSLNGWYDPVPALATTYLGRALGCPSSGATVVGGQTGAITTTTYAPCAVAGAATQTIQVTGGTHLLDTWPCGSPAFADLSGDVCAPGPNTTALSSSDGLSDPAAAWDFWTTHFP